MNHVYTEKSQRDTKEEIEFELFIDSFRFFRILCLLIIHFLIGENKMVKINITSATICILILSLLFVFLSSCSEENPTPAEAKEVPHEATWGIYSLDINSEEVELVFSSVDELDFLAMNRFGNKFAFARKVGGTEQENYEICVVGPNGEGYEQLSDNDFMDVYPSWSTDGTRIAFLSWNNETLDIYIMDSSGGNIELLYDSGFHDADINWSGNRIAFTRNSQIWSIKDDGTDPVQITDPPRAGEWGDANLPFGDYDPRYSPDNTKIVFERLVDDTSPHGNYDIFIVDALTKSESRITDNGYSQGIANWSHSGDELVYVVAAINDVGKYDIYMMNSDGSNNQNITPEYFPDVFLCHTPVFSADDSKIYFIGQWWE